MRMIIRMLWVGILLITLVSGAGAAQVVSDNWYKRVYSGLAMPHLNALVQRLFEGEGYKVNTVKPNSKVVASEWLEVAPAELKKDWKERNRFRSYTYAPVAGEKRAILVIDFIKEQQPPEGKRWQNKQIDYYNYRYYRDILAKMDQLVLDAGGQVSDMKD